MPSELYLEINVRRRPEQLAEFVDACAADLDNSGAWRTEPVRRELDASERGIDGAVIGQLIATFLTSGAAVALINCTKGWLARDHTVTIKLRNKVGQRIELSAKNLDKEDISEVLQSVSAFMKDGPGK